MKKYILGIALLLALPTLVLAAFKPATLTNGASRVAVYSQEVASQLFSQGYVLEGQEVIAPTVGSGSGQDHYNVETFWAGFGGKVLATTSPQTTYTITEGDLTNYSVFEMTPTVAASTWTLPATSTLSTLLRNEGDTKRWIFINATSTAGATFTLAKGTGWDLTGVDANVDVIAGAAAGSYVNMAVDCTKGKKTASRFDITCQLTENIAAD